MNVTSLLNTSSTVTRQPQEVNSRNRSRTPWDAGGYSLPLHPHPQSQQLEPLQQLQQSDSAIPFTAPVNQAGARLEGSNYYFRHGCSDSYGSLSSLSSTPSTTHSRFSSASTISGFTSTSTFSADDSWKDKHHRSQASEGSLSSFSPPYNSVFPRTLGPPTPSFDSLSVICEHHLHKAAGDMPRLGGRNTIMPNQIGTERQSVENTPELHSERHNGLFAVPSRTSSPTDAILIKRTPLPTFRDYAEPSDTAAMESSEQDTRYSHSSLQPDLTREPSFGDLGVGHTVEMNTDCLVGDLASHKRTISAPDLQSVRAQSRYGLRMPTGLGPIAEPTPPPSHDPDDYSPQEVTLYTDPNSPSQNVNYPRDSSRPPCMFMENCNLDSPIRKAISHIFGRNKMCTRLIPAGVWVYFCRKHYQRARYRDQIEYARNTQCKLIQQQIERISAWSDANQAQGEGGVVKDWGLALRKREQKRVDDLGEIEPSEITREDEQTLTASTPATAVPAWLRDLCGQTYNAREILDIFSRLHRELINAEVPVFPDIEILPNIVVDPEMPTSPKGYVKRKPVANTHQRSQSLGVRPGNGPTSFIRSADSDLSPASTAPYSDESDARAHKRKKTQGDAQYPMQAANNSGFPLTEPVINEESFKNPTYSVTHPVRNNIPRLRVPTAPRYNMRSTAAILDSDMSNPEDTYSPYSLHRRSYSGMVGNEHGQLRQQIFPGPSTSPGVSNSPTAWSEQIMSNHLRHQSTPTATNYAMSYFTGTEESGYPPPSRRHVRESQETKSLYTSRR